MSNILTSLIEKVKTEKTGKLMRKYITESLENINSRLFSCEESYKSSIADSGKSNKEIVDARIDSVNKVSYDILRERLDAMAQEMVNLRNLKNETIETIYPINQVIITMDSINPSTRYGGVWVQIAQGRVLIGAGTHKDKNFNIKTFEAGNEYGTYNHKLTKDELAQHSHSQRVTAGNGSDPNIIRLDYNSDAGGTGAVYEQGVYTGDTGSNKAFSVIQPSFGAYIWQRVA